MVELWHVLGPYQAREEEVGDREGEKKGEICEVGGEGRQGGIMGAE